MKHIFSLLLLSLLWAGTATASEFVDRSQFTGADWERIVKQAEVGPTPINPELIGGAVADPKDWPSSPWVGNCSSTVIGERTLLTAAHCVSNGGTKTFNVGTTRYSARCTHHPEYRGNSTADWALCYTDKAVPSGPYEVVATADQVGCEKGKTFTWTGYGCQRWGGGIDGKFRVGDVNAISCPSGKNYDTITRGKVALCSGDSGGGGYVVSGTLRLLVGANSRSNTTDTSYVSSTYTDSFRNWAASWSKSKETAICGIDPEAKGCKGSSQPDPQPDPDPVPPSCDSELTDLKAAVTGTKAAADALEACLKK